MATKKMAVQEIAMSDKEFQVIGPDDNHTVQRGSKPGTFLVDGREIQHATLVAWMGYQSIWSGDTEPFVTVAI